MYENELKSFIIDLKNIKRSSKRLAKRHDTDALTSLKKQNLYSTCQEAVSELSRLQQEVSHDINTR